MNVRVEGIDTPLRGDAPASVPRATLRGAVVDLLRLTKPRITALVVLTGIGGMWVATRTGAAAPIGWASAALALFGIALVVSGANALNMFLERDIDGLMERTAKRPLPAKRLPPALALVFGLFIGLGSLPLLSLASNTLTAALAGFALFSYVLVYTPLKQITPWALVIGAVPGAMPPLLGWTAVTGTLDGLGLALFAVLFFWQLPHSLAIATFRREQYTGAGFKVMPEVHGARSTRLQSVLYSAALLGSSLTVALLLPGPMGLGHWFYAAVASLLGGGFVALSVLRPVAGDRDIAWARRLFFASLVYLPALLAAMMVGVS